MAVVGNGPDAGAETASGLVAAVLLPDPGRGLLVVDYDGTLAPIVDDPELALPAAGAVDVLDRLLGVVGVVAVVSGRPAAFLADRLEVVRRPSLRCFGLYGMEEIGPDGRTVSLDPGDGRAALDEIAEEAAERAPGARVERKGHSVALHYREHPGAEPAVSAVADWAVERFALVARRGRMVVELVPEGASDKGTVVRRIAEGRDGAVAIGDDLGDVAAFVALDELARSGVRTAKVAVGGTEAPEALVAASDVVVDGPHAVVATLEHAATALGR